MSIIIKGKLQALEQRLQITMADYNQPTADIVASIKHSYHAYRHTGDIDRKGSFFSPDCMQICRPTPSYAATNRDEIVQYLRDAQQGKIPIDAPASSSTCISGRSDCYATGSRATTRAKERSVYTIRPLRPGEFGFGSDDITAPVGLTVEQMKSRAIQEGWVGMRVNLWDEGREGLLVKVQYWWRLRETANNKRLAGDHSGTDWDQCLHDIMFLGPKDGTENEEELELLE